jgi:hypothetical protein
MVPFAGHSMPVTYADMGLTESHNHVRSKAGLFDVSHMVQHRYVHSYFLFYFYFSWRDWRLRRWGRWD